MMDHGSESLLVDQISFVGLDFTKYLKFTLGAVVGASVESMGNIRNGCLADVASLITSGYHIYYYMTSYIQTEKDLALAWSITYMVKLFDTWFNIRCEAIKEFGQGLTGNMTAPSTKASRPYVMNHDAGYNNGTMPED